MVGLLSWRRQAADNESRRHDQNRSVPPHAPGYSSDMNAHLDAILDAGYGSPSRFYANSSAILGMTPRRYRARGRALTIHFGIGQCSLGAILVARTDVGLCAILLGDEPDALLQDLQQRFHQANLVGADPEFETWMAVVIGFVDDPACGLVLPLDIRGTAFQQRVWQALSQLPPGTTISYTELGRSALAFPVRYAPWRQSPGSGHSLSSGRPP